MADDTHLVHGRECGVELALGEIEEILDPGQFVVLDPAGPGLMPLQQLAELGVQQPDGLVLAAAEDVADVGQAVLEGLETSFPFHAQNSRSLSVLTFRNSMLV